MDEIKTYIKNDLIRRKLKVVDGTKFGADFLLYKKDSEHADWMCVILNDTETISALFWIAINRIATTTRKKILLAFYKNKNILYYQVEKISPVSDF